ncbi:MAG: RNA-binding protein [Alphaproteobacteria bacterium]|nr:RNA-binding protein [Alphaproteobacteria bacterium]
MEALALHLIRPLVAHPDDVQIQAVEGDAVTVLEALVHADDRALFEDDGGRTLRSICTVISAAAGRRKATVELVDAFGASAEE